MSRVICSVCPSIYHSHFFYSIPSSFMSFPLMQFSFSWFKISSIRASRWLPCLCTTKCERQRRWSDLWQKRGLCNRSMDRWRWEAMLSKPLSQWTVRDNRRREEREDLQPEKPFQPTRWNRQPARSATRTTRFLDGRKRMKFYALWFQSIGWTIFGPNPTVTIWCPALI